MVLKVCSCGAWHKQRPCPDCRAKKERGKQQRNRELGRNTAEWQRFRLSILKRDGYRCRDCPANQHLAVHRIGGGFHTTHDPDRYLSLCPPCHTRRQRAEQQELAGVNR